MDAALQRSSRVGEKLDFNVVGKQTICTGIFF